MRLKPKLLATSAMSALIACAFMAHAHANPLDGTVSAGSADITSSGKTLDITQHSDKAIIDWRGFDIGADETTNFIQPNASSLTVNRVNSTSASQINGHLNANGNIVIINQNGIVFGAGAVVDVHGLVATTSDSTNDRLLNDTKVHFDLPGNTSASIVNNGTITAHDAGLVGFVAPNVANNGVITANLGRVHLAAGDKATVDFYGDGLLEVQASDNLQHEIVTQTGQISADGGKIALTAAAGGQVVSSIINAQGVIHAQSVDLHDGEITIGAGKTGHSQVNVAGSIDASSAIGKGGKITVTGDNIVIKNTASIKASGLSGGGAIKIGGDMHGAGPTQTAQTVTVENGAYIENNAISFGDGGETIVWSDGYTSFEGLISGTGGEQGGNGGFVEVSGKDALNYDGSVDLSADDGYEYGTLLLDPTDITISTGTASGNTYASGTYTNTGATSVINVSTLVTQLQSANVVINTSSAFGGSGDITIANAINWAINGKNLTLTADRDILVNAAVNASASSTNSSITMTAGRDITLGASVTALGAGAVTVQAARNLTVSSGATIAAGTGGALSLKAAGGVITNIGLLTLNGAIAPGATGAVTLLSGLDSSSARTGDLTLNATTLTTASMAGLNISGFRDVTLGTSFASTGAGVVSVTAERNLTIASGATITAGASSAVSLRAAGGVITNIGMLTISGVLNQGSNALTLLSGLDLSSARTTDLTLTSSNYTQQGASVGAVSITGFRDVSVNTALSSSGAITIAANRDFSNGGAISATTSAITITSLRDLVFGANVTATAGGASLSAQATNNLTVNSGVTLTPGSTGFMSLKSAGGAITNTGKLTLNGVLNLGSGAFTLLSGLDSSTSAFVDLTLNATNTTLQGAAIGAVSITGFKDISIARALPSSGTVTITSGNDLTTSAAIASGAASALTFTAGRDLVFGGDVTGGAGASALTALATRNLTVNSGVTLTPGSSGVFSVRAAGGVTTNTGVLTMNGILNAGSNTLTLVSGVDASSNRVDLALTSANLLLQSGNTAVVSITGFRDLAVNRALTSTSTVTLTADRDFSSSAAITSGAAAGISITANRDITIGGNISGGTGASSITIQAARNLLISSGATIASGSTGALSLKSAGGVITNTGTLVLNGTLSLGSGAFTLLSGLDTTTSALVDLTLNGTNTTLQGATIAATSITGFKDITIARALPSSAAVVITAGNDFTSSAAISTTGATAITINASHDITFGGNVTGGTGASNVTALASRNLTINSGVTISGGSTGLLNLKAAGGIATNTGVLALNGTLSLGSGSFTLASGLDATSNLADLTLTATNATLQGAAVSTTSISGFRDITLARALPSTGSVSITAGRDFSSSAAISASASNITITSSRDVILGGNVSSSAGAGAVAIQAGRDLTVNTGVTVTGGSTGALSLKAAGGVATNTGILTQNGTLSAGTGAFTLISGLNSSSSLVDLALNGTNMTLQSTGIGTVAISGFRDIAINRTLPSSGAVTITADRDFSNNSAGAITSGTTTSTITINANRDITYGGNVTSGGAASAVFTSQAARNLSIASGVTLTASPTGSMSLKAAGGVLTNTGVLAINGTINLGTGAFTLASGLDSTSTLSDLTLNTTNTTLAGATIGAVTISGFRDIAIARDLPSTGAIAITAGRDLTTSAVVSSTTSGTFSLIGGRDVVLGSNITGATTGIFTATAARNLTVNSGVTVSSGGIILRAANNLTTNQGLLTINGSLNAGGLTFTLLTGLDLSGNRTQDLTLDSTLLTYQGASIGSSTITGFRDVTLARDLIGGSITVTAERDLNVNSGVTLQTSSNGSIFLKAAGGTITNTGLLRMNGVLNMGTGTFVLASGQDSLGNRQDLTLNATNMLVQSSGFVSASITGFRDITLARDLVMQPGTMNITAERNLTVNSGVTLTASSTFGFALKAAGGTMTNVGLLTMNGVFNVGAGPITLVSGVDSVGNRNDLTLNSSNLILSGTNIGAISITGYRDVVIGRDLPSTGAISIQAERNLTVNSGVTLTTALAGALTLKAAGGVTTNVGQLLMNGVINMGTSTLTLLSGQDATNVRPDLVLNNTNLLMQSTALGVVIISGYRDISLNSPYTISSLNLTADRDIALNGAMSGALNFTAGRDITFAANVTQAGAGSSVTALAARNLTINSGVTVSSGATAGINLRAANGLITNTGLLVNNGVLSIGSNGLTLGSGLDTSGVNSQNLALNSSTLVLQTATTGGITINGFRTVTISENISAVGAVTITAERNLILNSGVTLSGTGNIVLRAGGSSGVNIGELRLDGLLSLGSGSVVLTSGLDSSGNRTRDYTMDLAHLTMTNGAFDSFGISGFRDVTMANSYNFLHALSINAFRNITINSGVDITMPSAGIVSVNLKAANNDTTALGWLSMNGVVHIATGTLTMVSGVDALGNRNDFTLDSTNLIQQTPTMGGVLISGFRDVNINSAISATAFTIAADRDFTTSAAGVLSPTVGNTLTVTAGRDIVIGASITGAGTTNSLLFTAGRNLTVNSGVVLTPGTTGAISLKAAGGVITNQGVLTMNGILNPGATSLFTLTSGLDSSNARTQDLVLNTSNLTLQNGTLGAVTITGYRDITVVRDLPMGSGAIGITAERNLTINSGVTLTSTAGNSIFLNAAGGVTANVGWLNMNGLINMGVGTLTLNSGLDAIGGARRDLTLNTSNLTLQGATMGQVIIGGFRDITLDRSLPSGGGVTITADRDFVSTANGTITTSTTITAGRDITIGGNLSASTSGTNHTINAGRNITINSGVYLLTGSAGGVGLRAANGSIGNQGVLAINGVINIGSGTLTLVSGLDSSGNRTQDLTLNSGNLILQSVLGGIAITGFRDITIARDLTSATSTITAERNLTVNSGVTLTQTTNTSLNLRAAGGVPTNIGTLSLAGAIINIGTGGLGLGSGVDSSGNRVDLTFSNSNLVLQGANMGGLTIFGFRDITFASSFAFAGGVSSVTAERNLTINSGATETFSGTSMSLKSAGGSGGTGSLAINGNITLVGNVGLAMAGGYNTSGVADDLVLDTGRLTLTSANMGALTLAGFRNITFAQDIAFNGSTSVIAEGNLNINSGVTLTAPPINNITLKAGGNAGNNVGVVNINGHITMKAGELIMGSGLDTSGNRKDLTIDSSSWFGTTTPGSFGGLTLTGFRDVTIGTNLTFNTANSSIVAERNLTVNSGVTIADGGSGNHNITLRAGGSLMTNVGSLIYNGHLVMGSGTLFMTSGLDSSTGQAGTDITVSNSWLSAFNGSTIGAFALNGFRDVTFADSLTMTQSLSSTAVRNMTVNNGVVLQVAAAGGGITLVAGNNVTTNTGVLNMNGLLRLGSGILTLTSGTDSSGNRPDIVLDNAHLQLQGATASTLSVKGFRDITLATSYASTGSITVSAYRNTTVVAGVTLTTGGTGGLTLSAANSSTGLVGLLTLNGMLNAQGSGLLTLNSAVDSSGNRLNLVLDSSHYAQGSTVGDINITGFNDVTLATNLTSSQSLSIIAQHNLTINSGVTVTNGTGFATSLRAGGPTGVLTGVFVNNGLVKVGQKLTVTSGTDSIDQAADFNWSGSHYQMLGSDIGAVSIRGFRDILFNDDVSFNGNSTLQALRNVIMASGKTLTVLGNSSLNLIASNNTLGRGIVSINGTLSMLGTGGLSLNSGYDSTGNYRDLIWDGSSAHIIRSGTTTAGLTVTGYRDIIVSQDINSTGALYLQATRNVVINSGTSVTGATLVKLTGGNTTAGLTGDGTVTVNGMVNYGSGDLVLQSGSGTAAPNDLVFDSTHFTALTASFGNFTVSGFRDITINQSVNALNRDINITALRNLTIGSAATLTPGATNSQLNLSAAGGVMTNQGVLAINGHLVAGVLQTRLTSGLDGSGGVDFAFDGTKLTRQGALYGAVALNGFRDILMATDLSSNGYIDIRALRNLTVNSNVTLRVNLGNSVTLSAAGGNSQNAGLLKLDGQFYFGYLNTTLVSGYDPSTGARPDIVFDTTKFNYVDPMHNVSSFTLDGFRDITIGETINSAGLIKVIAQRNLTLAPGAAITGALASAYVAQTFTNNAGAGAITATGSGRWVVYSNESTTSQIGNLPYDFRVFNCSYGGACAALPGAGNGFVFNNDASNEVIADLHANSPLPDSVITYRPGNLQASVTPPGSTVADARASFGVIPDVTVLNSEYLPADVILTFSPELAERFGLKDWSF